MYNETLRKITSLSLLTILLTSTAAFAMPNALPAAHASTNANLFVSAENSQFNNYFAGPQVIQVVVSDPDIQRLDQVYGEPVVTVNGKRLRMAQGTDGNWYAYLADRNMAIAAANTAAKEGKGLNFGGFCSSTSTLSPKSGVNYLETKGFTIARGGFNSVNHTATNLLNSTGLSNQICTNVAGGLSVNQMEHVVRQNKTLNGNGNGFAAPSIYGQIWPVIQLYDFSGFPATVTVDYAKAGGDQISTLTFDRIPGSLVTSSVDRTAYPANSQVFVTLNDPQLNVDPTEEDSWTWGANSTNSTVYYMAFNRNGGLDADGTAGMQNLFGNLTSLMFDHNGKFTINPAAQAVNIVDFQANGKEKLVGAQRGQTNAVRTSSIGLNSAPVTFIESGGTNTGVFVTWDGAKVSDLVTSNTLAIRGQSASVRYNDVSTSIVGGFGYGTLTTTTTNGTWASGQKIPMTLVDADQNLNSKITEHKDLFRPTDYQSATGGVPTMTIGTPFSLANGIVNDKVTFIRNSTAFVQSAVKGQSSIPATVTLTHSSNTTTNTVNADVVNVMHIALVTPTTGSGNSTFKSLRTGGVIIDSSKTVTQLLGTIHNDLANDTEKFRGFNFINYDLRSLATNATFGGSNVGIYLITNPAGTGILQANGHLVNSGAGFKLTSLANSSSLEDFINLNGTATLVGDTHGGKFTPGKIANGTQITLNLFHNIAKTASVGLFFNFTTPATLDTSQKPIAADFFSIGILGDGKTSNQKINNGIYRWELDETGDNTSTFTGTAEYVMLNQVSVLDPNTYSALGTINHDIKFAAIQDMLQSESRAPQISYQDLGFDGVNSLISTQQDIATHTGSISFNPPSLKVGNTITVTLNDADLNSENDLVDIFVTVPSGVDPAADTIGKSGFGVYSDGSPFGRLFDIKFGKTLWAFTGCFPSNSIAGTAQGLATSLSASGFVLVETGPSSGIFAGTFDFPDQFCSTPTTVASTAGFPLVAEYADFTNDSGMFNVINVVVYDIRDQTSCQSIPGSTSWNQATSTCKVTNTSLTLNSVDFLTVENGITLAINGGNISNLGTITNSGIIVNSAGSITNFGTINNIHTIPNSGGFANNGTMTNSGTINNSGLISNNSGGTISNHGTINDNNHGTISNSGTLTNNIGAIINNNSGGTLITNSGTLTNSGTITNSAVIINNSGGTITNSGTINNNASGITNSGTISNSGTINNSSIINNNHAMTNSGTITNPGTISNPGVFFNSGTITTSGLVTSSGIFKNFHILSNSPGGSISILGSFINSGIIINRGTVTNNSGGTISNLGTINNFHIITNSGTISNSGVINDICQGTISGPVSGTQPQNIPCLSGLSVLIAPQSGQVHFPITLASIVTGGLSPYTYQWNIVTAPVGSSAVISNPTSASPSFTPDVAGSYQFSLTVTDLLGSNAKATRTITAT